MYKLLEWLHGKSTTIVSLLGLILTYVVAEHWISNNLAVLLAGILTLLSGGKDALTTVKLGTTRK